MANFFIDKLSKVYVGIGYIIVPQDMDRDEYIQYCLLNSTVSIYPETGGVSYNNVTIADNCLNYIEFPENGDILGSCVIYVLHPQQKIPIIIGVLSKVDGSFTLNYKLFKLFKESGNNSVSITGDGENGNLLINLTSDTEEGGQLIIDINNYSDKGELKLRVKGNITIISNNLSLVNNDNILISSSSTKIDSKNIEINSDTCTLKGKELHLDNDIVKIGEASEFAVMGETLKNDILIPLLKTLKTFSIIVNSFGPTTTISPATQASLISIENSIQKLLSKKLKLN